MFGRAASVIAARFEDHVKECSERFRATQQAIKELGADYTTGLNRIEGQLRGSIEGRQKQIDELRSFLSKIMLMAVCGLLSAIAALLFSILHAKGIL